MTSNIQQEWTSVTNPILARARFSISRFDHSQNVEFPAKDHRNPLISREIPPSPAINSPVRRALRPLISGIKHPAIHQRNSLISHDVLLWDLVSQSEARACGNEWEGAICHSIRLAANSRFRVCNPWLHPPIRPVKIACLHASHLLSAPDPEPNKRPCGERRSGLFWSWIRLSIRNSSRHLPNFLLRKYCVLTQNLFTPR